ncbi:hypothetical protein ACO0SA_002588 [Hanseniaspora valbyensis]
MRIFSKGKKESHSSSNNNRSFHVGSVEKTSTGGSSKPTIAASNNNKPYIKINENNYNGSVIDQNNKNDNSFLKPPPSLSGVLTEKKRSSSITNMMRILSGGNSNSTGNNSTSNINSLSSDNSTDNSNSPTEKIGFHKTINSENNSISPELVPIVTLLSAQAHRRYHVGVFLLFQDLNNDGSPAERSWKEQYAVLIGNQVALWNSKDLEQRDLKIDQQKTQQELAHELFNVASKPKYLNLTDAKYKILEGKENTLVLSTTMKNRYFMKFSDTKSFKIWHAALRLCAFEYTSLQEAYTGAFLSSKGAKLSDIKVILADSKFNYEDWVSVRFGAGMPWKRCYAVVTPGKGQSSKKKKNQIESFGEVVFYENEKKSSNKRYAMSTITSAFSIFAIYPSSPVLIDNSTMLKIEGEIEFNDFDKKNKDKKNDKSHWPSDTSKEGDIFIMPENHNGVPGYDTIIRFLVPMLNSFHLYGRPNGLISARDDLNSLLFGLPTLPEIHYLQVSDLLPLTGNSNSQYWDDKQWKSEIKNLMLSKLQKGYSGCGSASGYSGAVMTGSITTGELFGNTNSPKQQPMARFISGSESPIMPKKTSMENNSIQSPKKLPSASPLKKIPTNAPVNGLGLHIKPPSNNDINNRNYDQQQQQPRTPTQEGTSGMNIPQFNSSTKQHIQNQNQNQSQNIIQNQNHNIIPVEKKVAEVNPQLQSQPPQKSPYHQYKQASSISPEKIPKKTKTSEDKYKINSNPLSVGKASGANAAAFVAAAPSSSAVEETSRSHKHGKKKSSSSSANKGSSSKNARTSVSSNASIIDSYANNNNAYNNAFSKPTSGLGIVSSNHATPKKNNTIEEEKAHDDDDYVVENTAVDPLADFYKLSRTLSNFNTLDKPLSKDASPHKSERPANKQMHSQTTINSATKQAKKYIDDGLPDDFNTGENSYKSNEEIFYDVPQQQPPQSQQQRKKKETTHLKKSPQLKNISTFVNSPSNQPQTLPTIMASPTTYNAPQTPQQQHHHQQQQKNIYQHGQPKQPQGNTYYKQHQQALNINVQQQQQHARPMPSPNSNHQIQYQQRQYSPVNVQQGFIPQQHYFPQNMNNLGHNMYMPQQQQQQQVVPQPQRPYMQQRTGSNGHLNTNKNSIAQQYKGKTGGFSQFMPQQQAGNPYGN